MDQDRLIDGYWEHYRLASSDARADRLQADEFFWAWETAQQLIVGRDAVSLEDGDRLALLTALAHRAPDEQALAYLGAGPIEDLLRRDGPPIALIDEHAQRNEKFRVALRCAWFDEDLPAADAERLRRFGPPL